MRILAVDLAARASGWIVLDTETMAVWAHGVVSIAGRWDYIAANTAYWAWYYLLEEHKPTVLTYEVPGGADRRDAYKGKQSMAQAECALWLAAVHAHVPVIEAVDQAEVKASFVREGPRTKEAVHHALRMLYRANEFHGPPDLNTSQDMGMPLFHSLDLDKNFTEHELDALAIALHVAAILKLKAMATPGLLSPVSPATGAAMNLR